MSGQLLDPKAKNFGSGINLFTYEEKKELDELCKKADLFFASYITSKARLGGVLLVIKKKIEEKGYSWKAFVDGKWGGIKGMSFTSTIRYINEYYEYGNFINDLKNRGIILGEEALLRAWEETKNENKRMMEQEYKTLEQKLAEEAEQHFNFNFKKSPKKRRKADIEKEAKDALKNINLGNNIILDDDDVDYEDDKKLVDIYFIISKLLESPLIRNQILMHFKIKIDDLVSDPLICIKKITEELFDSAKESGTQIELKSIIKKLKKKDIIDQNKIYQSLFNTPLNSNNLALQEELARSINTITPDGNNLLLTLPNITKTPNSNNLLLTLPNITKSPMDLDFFSEANDTPLPE